MNFPSLFLLVLANLWLVSASSEIQLSDNPSPVFIYESIGKALIDKNTLMSGFIHGEPGNGRLFNDSRDLGLSALTPCVGVELTWFPSHLESIRFIYTADDAYDRSVYHGGDTGAAREKFILENGEKIVKMKTYTGTREQAFNDEKSVSIVGIQFTTTKGRVSRLFGSSKGRDQSELFDTFALGYAVGTSGKVLNQLQIVWQNQETVKVNENNTFVAYCYNAPESKSLKLVIIKATYQSKDDPALTVADVTDKARKRCGDKNSCKFTVNDANLQKHMCFDCSKELEITYACSYHRKIYGPLITNRKYIGNDISKDNQEYISDVKNLDDCGRHCLGQSDCGGVQLDRDHRCYLKSKMAEYENEDGWMAMAVVH